jgi:hypothetical protein
MRKPLKAENVQKTRLSINELLFVKRLIEDNQFDEQNVLTGDEINALLNKLRTIVQTKVEEGYFSGREELSHSKCDTTCPHK